MDAKQFIESGILETYAMGLASEQEAKMVAEMVARYSEVKSELRAIEASIENFDQKNAVEPPVHLKEKILSKVSGSPFPVSGSVNGKNETKVVSIAPQKQSNMFKYAAGVAVLLFAGSVIYIVQLRSDVSRMRDQVAVLEGDTFLLNHNLATMDTLSQTLSSKVAALNSEVNILKHPGMKSIELSGMEVAPDAKAMVYANVTTGESYLEIMNLPAAPEGMQYQFWGIVDGKPVDAGMITIDADSTGIHPMKTIPNSTAYAISLEPKGGSQSPTGKIYVMGNS